MGWCHRPLNVALFDAAIFHEKTTPVMRIVLYAGLTNVILNLVAIPWLGINGAMIVSFITYIVLGFVGFMMPSVRKYAVADYQPLLLLLVMLVASTAAYFVPELSVNWRIFLTFSLFAGAFIWYLKKGKEIVKAVNEIKTH